MQRAVVAGGLAALLFSACDAAPPPTPAATARAAASFDRYRRPDLLVAALDLHGGERVAEIGAGDGYLTLPIAAAVGAHGRVVATDIDAAALARLASKASAATASAPIETRRVSPDGPGLDGEFDLMLLAEVDHLLSDRAAYLAALRPHLARGGRLVVSNRRHDRAALVADATHAGFTLRRDYAGLPAHFLLFFDGETP